MNLQASAIAKLPKREEYIMPGTVPGSLEADKEAVGGEAVESKISYSFRMTDMKPQFEDAQGSVRGPMRLVFTQTFPWRRVCCPSLLKRTLPVSIVVRKTMRVLFQILWQRERSVEP
jgi:hypothetical protein